jgi:hypothetical protein
MDNRNTLSTIALVFSGIRLLAILISSFGMLLSSFSLISGFFNVIFYAGSVIHIAIILYIAFALSLIKESIWRSLAYVISALASATFLSLNHLGIHNIQMLSSISAVNILIVIFFTVQSFLVSNQFFKNAFRVYSLVLLVIMAFNMAVPYLAYKLALPMTSLRFTSFLYIIPASVKLYIVYLFYQYFNSAMIYKNNGFMGKL